MYRGHSAKRWLCAALSACLLMGATLPAAGSEEEIPALAATAIPAPAAATAESGAESGGSGNASATAAPESSGASGGANASAVPSASATTAPESGVESGGASASAAPSPEASPSPSPAPDAELRIVGFAEAELRYEIGYGVPVEEIGLPAALNALLSDGSTLAVEVAWRCVSDGLGGAEYLPEHENPLEAAYRFEAQLMEARPCDVPLPAAIVVYALPMLGIAPIAQLDWLGDKNPYEILEDGTVRLLDGCHIKSAPPAGTKIEIPAGASVSAVGDLANAQIYCEGTLGLSEDMPGTGSPSRCANIRVAATASISAYAPWQVRITNTDGVRLKQFSMTSASATLRCDGPIRQGRWTLVAGRVEGDLNFGMDKLDMAQHACVIHSGLRMDGTLTLGGTTTAKLDLRAHIGTLRVNGCHQLDYTGQDAGGNNIRKVVFTKRWLNQVAGDNTANLQLALGSPRYHQDAMPTTEWVDVKRDFTIHSETGFGPSFFQSIEAKFDLPSKEAFDQCTVATGLPAKLKFVPVEYDEYTDFSFEVEDGGVIDITIPLLPVYVDEFSAEVTYNGGIRFENVSPTGIKLKAASELDTNSPLLLNPAAFDLRADVTVNPFQEKPQAVKWDDNGQPVAVSISYVTDTVYGDYIVFSSSHPDAGNYELKLNFDSFTLTTQPKPVLVSGEIIVDPNQPISAFDALAQAGVQMDGFIGEDSFEGISGALASLNLQSLYGDDLLADPQPESTVEVEQIASARSNYRFVPENLRLKALKLGIGSVEIENWDISQAPATPSATSSTHTGEAQFRYAPVGTNLKDDSLWSVKTPGAPGKYTVRAEWPAQGEYGRLLCSADFEVTGNSIDWDELSWTYDPLNPFPVNANSIRLTGPDSLKWLLDVAEYKNQTDDVRGYNRMTVSFPSYPGITAPESLRTVIWCRLTEADRNVRIEPKYFQCDVKATYYGTDIEADLSSQRFAPGQCLVFEVRPKEGCEIVAFAVTGDDPKQATQSTSFSLAQMGENKFRLTIPSQDQNPVKLVIGAAAKDAGSALQEEPVLQFYDASPDGTRPSIPASVRISDYIKIDPDAPIYCSPSTYPAGNIERYEVDEANWTLTVSDMDKTTREAVTITLYRGVRPYSNNRYGSTIYELLKRSKDYNFHFQYNAQENFAGRVSIPSERVAVGAEIPLHMRDFSDEDLEGVNWQWQRKSPNGGDFVDIPGGNALRYAPTADDLGCELRLRYDYRGGKPMYSTNTATCADAVAGALKFNCSASEVYFDGSVTLTAKLTADPSYTGGSIQFYVDDAPVGQAAAMDPGQTATFELSGKELKAGTRSVYAVWTHGEAGAIGSNDCKLERRKYDLSNLLTATPVADETAIYGESAKFTISAGPDWPEELPLKQYAKLGMHFVGQNTYSPDTLCTWTGNSVSCAPFDISYQDLAYPQYMSLTLDHNDYSAHIATAVIKTNVRPVLLRPVDVSVNTGQTPVFRWEWAREEGYYQPLSGDALREEPSFRVKNAEGAEIPAGQLANLSMGDYTIELYTVEYDKFNLAAGNGTSTGRMGYYDLQVQTGTLHVTDAPVGYTVTIPSQINLDGDGNAELEIAYSVASPLSHPMRLSVRSENNYFLRCGDAYISYNLLDGKGKLINDEQNTALEFSDSGSTRLRIRSTIQTNVAGDYADTLTFILTDSAAQ